jgi:heme/copper-type cytochrome/quinol oxidase subunit 1
MYLVTTFVFFILGGVEALLIRLQLGTAENTLLSPQTYNQLFTMHGTTMVFLFVVPIMAGFGNYLIPLMIGARDMAFPKLNALSFWLLAPAASSSTPRSSSPRPSAGGRATRRCRARTTCRRAASTPGSS